MAHGARRTVHGARRMAHGAGRLDVELRDLPSRRLRVHTCVHVHVYTYMCIRTCAPHVCMHMRACKHMRSR